MLRRLILKKQILLYLLIGLMFEAPVQAQEPFNASDCSKVKPRKVESLSYKADNTIQTGWLTVPIFYATDRDASCNCFSQEQVPQAARPNMHYGVKNIAAPLTKHLQEPIPRRNGLACGWKSLEGNTRPNQVILQSLAFDVPNQKLESYSSFSKELEGYRQRCLRGQESPRDEIVVLVHGCCQPFNNHMDHAAFLATWMKVPIVSYDWASPNVGLLNGKLSAYRRNEILNQRNQDRFNTFINSLIADFGGSKIVIIAHSMGNRLLEQYLLQQRSKVVTHEDSPEVVVKESATGRVVDMPTEDARKLQVGFDDQDRVPAPNNDKAEQLQRTGNFKQRIKEVVFACADTDADAFAEHIDKITRCASVTRVIQSDRDKLLGASRFLHGKYSRLGTVDPSVDSLLRPLTKTKKMRLEVLDVSELDVNHSLPLWVVSSRHKGQKFVNPRFQLQDDDGILRYKLLKTAL